MDPRPFEACLLSTKSCGAKAAESMLVAPPWNMPAPEPEMRSITLIAPPH
jgi:hypothetical protein